MGQQFLKNQPAFPDAIFRIFTMNIGQIITEIPRQNKTN